MPINNETDANARLVDKTPLTEETLRGLMPYIGQITGGPMRRLDAELALQNIAAFRKFDAASS